MKPISLNLFKYIHCNCFTVKAECMCVLNHYKTGHILESETVSNVCEESRVPDRQGLEHDPVVSQGCGDGALVCEFYICIFCRLFLIPCHSDIFHLSNLGKET